MTDQIDAIVTMANLMYCKNYREAIDGTRQHNRSINLDKLIDDILYICRFTLMVHNIQGFILFNPTNNNFYFRNYEPTNN